MTKSSKIIIQGSVSEVARGTDMDILTISDEKRKSKIKCPFEALNGYVPGDRVQITIDRDPTLFED